MIRTKDLVLFVSILVVLFLAISATIANRMLQAEHQEQTGLGDLQAAHRAYQAGGELEERDRKGAIARLRELIAAGDVIDASPSVTDSVTPTLDAAASTSPLTLQCTPPDTGINVARRWPLESVALKIVEGVRSVHHTTYAPLPVGTSSTPQILTERSLLQLPLTPAVLAEPICLDSEIVGVTTEGSLIFNNDSVLYRQASPETLIGYARDGFPIYGPYPGALDECGGYQSPIGYRYAASVTEPTFLRCFKGLPQAFNP